MGVFKGKLLIGITSGIILYLGLICSESILDWKELLIGITLVCIDYLG